MALNFRRFVDGIQIFPKTSSTASLAGEIDFDSTNNRLNLNNGTTTSPVVTETHADQGSHRLQNKDLDNSNVAFVDPSDTTKKIEFEDASATTGTTLTLHGIQTVNRDITFPDTTGFVVVSGSSGIITNNLLDESSVWFVDTSDHTKAFKFDVSGATTGTSITLQSNQTANRVLTLPDSTDTLVARNTTDTLTNKTLTAPIINNATADTITGIAGGLLTIQSANNQNLELQSQGSGVVLVQNITFTNDTITGSTGADLSITTQSNKNIQLSPNGTGHIVANKPFELVQYFRSDRADDSTTTGTATTLSAFTTSFVKVTNGSLVSISAIPAGADGQRLILSNGTGNSIQINDEDTGVTAANRIRTGTGATSTLNNNASIELIYDTGASRWKVEGSVGGPPTITGSRGSPTLVTTTITTVSTAINQVIFIAGNGGPQTVTTITSGSITGQSLLIVGRDNTNTVTIQNSSGSIELNGNVTLGLSDTISLFWDGTAWVETSRS